MPGRYHGHVTGRGHRRRTVDAARLPLLCCFAALKHARLTQLDLKLCRAEVVLAACRRADGHRARETAAEKACRRRRGVRCSLVWSEVGLSTMRRLSSRGGRGRPEAHTPSPGCQASAGGEPPACSPSCSKPMMRPTVTPSLNMITTGSTLMPSLTVKKGDSCTAREHQGLCGACGAMRAAQAACLLGSSAARAGSRAAAPCGPPARPGVVLPACRRRGLPPPHRR